MAEVEGVGCGWRRCLFVLCRWSSSYRRSSCTQRYVLLGSEPLASVLAIASHGSIMPGRLCRLWGRHGEPVVIVGRSNELADAVVVASGEARDGQKSVAAGRRGGTGGLGDAPAWILWISRWSGRRGRGRSTSISIQPNTEVRSSEFAERSC